MEIFKNIDELKALTDKLIIETIEFVQEDVTLKLNIEKLTNEGALLMAKTRYDRGPHTVSVSQLPAESDDGREFKALTTIERVNNDLTAVAFKLESHEIDKKHIEPIKWFGILVPQSLKTARDRYEKAIELIVESANIEQRLKKNYELLDKLRQIRTEFEDVEE